MSQLFKKLQKLSVIFWVIFTITDETDKKLVIPDGNTRKILESHENENNLAVVKYGENLISNGNENFGADGHECNEHYDRVNSSMVIPHILFRDEITDIEVKQLGLKFLTEETKNGECSSSKRKKFFFDPVDISESLSNQFDSCGEDSSTS
ncbi:hypothetical protein D8674_038992 [Pyrus ussuriensis x Pyrus communis]|uniref:Uncharacterized protein n=1 Tax=Pyrus ussuriensis x Pyrus communis TaxID=2448454 RepID=A0A5N5GXF0_9ROSA|nr:hypothetical protein D8674_038992 [Pyrus ussuriensis x Pyrus communis]